MNYDLLFSPIIKLHNLQDKRVSELVDGLSRWMMMSVSIVKQMKQLYNHHSKSEFVIRGLTEYIVEGVDRQEGMKEMMLKMSDQIQLVYYGEEGHNMKQMDRVVMAILNRYGQSYVDKSNLYILFQYLMVWNQLESHRYWNLSVHCSNQLILMLAINRMKNS